jgi:hypothetical protein
MTDVRSSIETRTLEREFEKVFKILFRMSPFQRPDGTVCLPESGLPGPVSLHRRPITLRRIFRLPGKGGRKPGSMLVLQNCKLLSFTVRNFHVFFYFDVKCFVLRLGINVCAKRAEPATLKKTFFVQIE